MDSRFSSNLAEVVRKRWQNWYSEEELDTLFSDPLTVFNQSSGIFAL